MFFLASVVHHLVHSFLLPVTWRYMLESTCVSDVCGLPLLLQDPTTPILSSSSFEHSIVFRTRFRKICQASIVCFAHKESHGCSPYTRFQRLPSRTACYFKTPTHAQLKFQASSIHTLLHLGFYFRRSRATRASWESETALSPCKSDWLLV